MPKSRNSRSVSPQKPVSADSLEIERRKIYQNVHDIFCEAVDGDVIKLVIQECNWKEEESIEKLLVIAENVDEQRKYKSKLQRIAEGIFGSLRSEDYAQSGVSSTLSQSDRVIRRPTKPPTSVNNDKTSDQPAEKPVSRGIHHHGYPPQPVPSPSVVSVDEIEMDLNFPQLPSRVSELNKSSASSSVTSQRSFNEVTKTSLSSKTALLSQAQSAYSQQFDDAEGTQRWEEYKDKLSEHYLTTLKDANDSLPKKSPSASVFPDDPAILQAELARPKSDPLLMRQDIEKQRSESSRSFPVRLLSRSPDSLEDLKTLPVSSIGHGNVNKPDDFLLRSTGDLDETVLKCIYEIHDDLLDDSELERHSKLHSADSKLLAKSSNEPMTLPTIGLSANAAEFVPRPKPVATTTTAAAASTTEVVDSPSPEPTSRTKRSNSEELKPGMRKGGTSISSPSIPIGSPLTISPALSPGLSPQMNSPVANLTGSPMFITPKWPQVHTGMAPLQHVVLAPPQRYVHPTPAHHISPPYRFPPTASVPYSSRMVYSVAPPPMFRAAGMPPYVQQPNLQSLEDRAAVATGQPIMATSESSTAVLSTVMLTGQSSIEQKVEKVRKQQQSGVKVLIIVRGLPGSGKSTLARALQLNGIVLSTDDYFMNGNRYEYKPEKLNDAHQWNKERAKEAMKMGKSPIVIDNTNTMVWEFKPYITMGVNNNYHVEIFEPDTPWKFKPSELARRTLHGVPVEHIKRMLQRYEHNITIDSVLKTKSTPDLKSYTASDEPELSQLSTGSDDKSTISQEDIPMPSIRTPESRIGKDVRFQTLNKSEEFRKQKSGESDSDSLSSYHSETWSNQSSRNASPKPLRSSLKTPGTLQKIEKLKAIGSVKQGTVKPTVRKVKRKAIKQIEAKLSSDTLTQVNEMVKEHVNGQVLSVEDVSKTEEELKALLQFCAIDEAELASAEELIGLKLHDAIHQSFEGPDVNIEGSGTESEGDTKSADSLTTLNESSSNLCDEIDGEYNSHEEKKVEFGLGDPDVTGEEKESTDTNRDSKSKRPMPSWMDIATVETSVSCNPDLLNDSVVSEENAEVVELTGEGVSRTHEEFELKYWSGETDINGMKVESTVKTADHVWDGEKWEGNEKDGEKCVKPQRMKKNRRDKSLSEEGDQAVCNDSANSNLDSSVLSHDENDEVYESCSDVENDEHGLNNKNEMTSTDDLTSSEDNLISNNSDNSLVNTKSPEINTNQDGGHIENNSESSKINLQSTENSLSCSGSVDVTSITNDEPIVHDQSDSSVNSSLQLLKDSYTDTESAIKSSINNNNCDNDLLGEVASSDVKDITMKQDETIVECEQSERDSSVERKGEDDVCKEPVKDVIRESEPSSDQNVTQSVTMSEVIKKDTEKGPSDENSAPGSPKKKSSRNRNGKKVPFLNSEDTEKFKKSDWSSFPLVSNEGIGVVTNGNMPVSSRNMTTVGTMTSVEYFNIVVQLNQGGFVSEDIKYLTGNPGKKLVNGVTNELDIKKVVERPAEVCLLEKSTTTADLVSLNSSEGVEFLQTCFPAVENEELECVLEMCSNNVEWAINLLLDWKYSMNLTQEEKKDFSDKMAEIQKDKGTDNVQTDFTDMVKGPSSLLDMCFNFIEKENIANRGDIESQMIKTGKERLDTIEKDNITKIKLHRSLSRGESSLDKSALLNSLDETNPDLTNLNNTQTRTHVEDTEVFSSKTEGESRKESILNGTAGVSFDDYIRGKIMKSSLPEQRDITTTDAHIEPVMTMDVRPDVITQLEDMFGPLQCKDNANSKLSVPIDRKTAWMLYQCVKNCLVRSPVDDQQQLLRDEEFARQLQEEEEAYKKLELNKTSNGTRTTRATPTIGYTVKGTIPSQHEQVSWRSGSKSLAEIMREQQQHQDSQNEFQKLIENEGAHTVLSTRLKRQKLYEAFPAVDKIQLDEIFQACCFNLSETIQAISSSLNEGPYKFPMPVASSTPQVPEPDDQQLIEAAKQQSIDEMMDLCSYHPGTGKDYQDGMEPEYEDYRGEANLHHKLRQECFLKAREAYRRGLKQVASFYSQQGHQHTQKLKEANMRASDQILADRNDDIERNKTLDLHGLHIDEAREALTRIIPQKERERCKQLTVITGRGSHSKGGVAKLRPAIIDYLNRNKYNYTELSIGVFRVSLKYRTPDR